MRVSRTRFSKRRSKRKTEFPIVAVVQKKRKVESIKSQSFGLLNNKISLTKEQKGAPSKPLVDALPLTKNNASSSSLLSQERNAVNSVSSLAESNNFHSRDNPKENRSKVRQKVDASKPQKKSRASIDYKNVILLRNLITAEGKILPRRINKLTAKQQRYVQKAIKSARIMGLIPFINKSRPF